MDRLPSDGSAFRDLTFEQALERAREERKLVVAAFYIPDCEPWRQLARTTWSDVRVIEWLHVNAVAVKVDAKERTDLAERYTVVLFPTLVFVGPNGGGLASILGNVEAESFLQDAEDVLAGEPPRTRGHSMAKDVESARQAFVGHEDDPMARLTLGQTLVRAGQGEEALEHLLWCWDEALDPCPDFAGVRRSFLMGDLTRLAGWYPAAASSMRARLFALQQSFLAGDVGADRVWSAAGDIECLARNFVEDKQATLALYDRIVDSHGKADPRAVALRAALFERLVEARRYDEALDVPVDHAARIASLLEAMTHPPRELTEESFLLEGESMAEHRARFAMEAALPYVEVFAGAGRGRDALAVAEIAIDVFPRRATVLRLLECARRAGAPEVGRAVMQVARDILEGEELAGLDEASEWTG